MTPISIEDPFQQDLFFISEQREFSDFFTICPFCCVSEPIGIQPGESTYYFCSSCRQLYFVHWFPDKSGALFSPETLYPFPVQDVVVSKWEQWQERCGFVF